ncbi:hypothetical protein C5C44_14025 [Rathayibacter sp. AY1F6]|nr:hypothetical protein C5C44_14025 [Rathayibacter sp. AY1F6]
MRIWKTLPVYSAAVAARSPWCAASSRRVCAVCSNRAGSWVATSIRFARASASSSNSNSTAAWSRVSSCSCRTDVTVADSATASPFFTASVLVPVRLAIAAADTPSNASCAHAAVRSATLSSARWSFSMIC